MSACGSSSGSGTKGSSSARLWSIGGGSPLPWVVIDALIDALTTISLAATPREGRSASASRMPVDKPFKLKALRPPKMSLRPELGEAEGLDVEGGVPAHAREETCGSVRSGSCIEGLEPTTWRGGGFEAGARHAADIDCARLNAGFCCLACR